ncbi:TetR/AcrR family transcriptional regulator [Agreia sp. VKM Ac-1783]|uniref:TetR/AcrR family transcriptional regulator n=1 Tax=Agreia sp. VKM Ac-1783 TaxID=1938889 RepID=UPI000A2ABC99|nr:TetR/AcrR family transcriptional regulator [Agreia sp. VKM Ac-1783]SMQ74890.1 transcriptional regulator, TetR family [Agreia sp. VKM Ac-1783]
MAATRTELREATRERVLAAADRLFRERGFDAATIRDIAEASGVSVGSVMATGDKNALLVQIFDGLIEAGHERSTSDAGDDTSCAQHIVNLVRPFVSLFASRQDLSRTYASIQVSGREPSPLFSRLAKLLVDEITSTITRHGCTTLGAVAPTAQAIYFAYLGTLFSWSARTTIDEGELTDSLHATFAAICTCKE